MALVLFGTAAASAQDLGTPVPLEEAEREWLTLHDTIRIAPAPNFPPVEFFDENDVFVGIAADYMALFEQRLGITFEVIKMDSWSDVVEATMRGEIDMWFEAGITPERREFLDFTEPYLRFPAVIVVRTEVSGNLSLEDLAGQRVAAVEGYATVDFIREQAPGIDVVTVPSIEDGLTRVSFGSADAMVISNGPASYYIAQLGLTNLRVAGESGFVWELAIGSRSDWPELGSIMGKTLESISPSTRRDILRDWVSLESSTGQGLSSPLLFVGLIVLLVGAIIIMTWQQRRFVSSVKSSARRGEEIQIRTPWPVYATATGITFAIAALALVANNRIKHQMQSDIGNSVRTVLNTTSTAVYDWLRNEESQLQLWSSRPEILSICTELLNGGVQNQDAQTRLATLLSHLTGDGDHIGYVMLSDGGSVLASDLPLGGQLGNPHVTDLLSSVSGSPGASGTTVPFRISGSNGETFSVMMAGAGVSSTAGQCVLAFVSDPEQQFTAILQRGRIGQSGETYAFNRTGQLLSESRFEEDLRRLGLISDGDRGILNIDIRDPGGNLVRGFIPTVPRGDQPLTLMALEATNGRQGLNLDGYNDYRGVPVIGAWVWDDTNGLGIATEMDADEAYGSFYQVRRLIIGGAGFSATLVLILTGLFIRNRTLLVRASQEHTRSILDTALDAVVLMNGDGVVTFCNPQADQMFGWSEGEGDSQELARLILQREKTPEGPPTQLSGPTSDSDYGTARIETTALHREGHRFPVELTVMPIQSTGGVTYSAFIRDITNQKRAEDVERQKDRMESELNVARDIQMSMLPLTFPAFPRRSEIDVFATLIPAREVGGDFYDFYFVDEEHLFFCIGDVSGKGVPAALFMAVTKTLLKTRAANDSSPASIVTGTNGELSSNNPSSMFVTLFAGILNVFTGEIRYTNAGHNPPLVKDRAGTVTKLDQLHGPVVGAVDELLYKESRMVLEPGDTLFLYTDGVNEAMNSSKELFTEKRLVDWLTASASQSVKSMVDSSISEVREFEGVAPQADDITAMAIRCLGVQPPVQNLPESLDIEITNDHPEIQRAIDTFGEFAVATGISEQVRNRFKIVIDELLNNVVSYAYQDAEVHSIGIHVIRSPSRLAMTIEDDGVPFNPLSHKAPNTDATIEERIPGGLGIHLIRSMMTESAYHRRAGKNVIEIVLDLREKSE